MHVTAPAPILNAQQRELLSGIRELHPITTKALAEEVGRTVSATSSALKRLADRNLITSEHRQREGDRVWFLTAAGEKVFPNDDTQENS